MVDRTVLAGSATNGTAILDVTTLPAGMCYLAATTTSGCVVRRVIKHE